ncbi:MAG TPA: hypothetical protein VHE30_15925 [Polyangiaceae bacterium]|nr:hypothetical protein [Polyangiaceae bacterium]
MNPGRLHAAVLAVLAGCGVSACRKPPPPPAEKARSLGGDAVAVVGSERIEADTVKRIAEVRGIGLGAARTAAIWDALLAEGARRTLPGTVVANAERSARARRLLETLRSEARDRGPPTDEEVREASLGEWWALDCPALRRVTHAVALVQKPERDAEAHAVAERIASAVAHATDVARFREIAKALPVPDGLTVRVEDLDPVARDGRSVNPEHPPPAGTPTREYSKIFARAVFDTAALGKPSGVVKTEFGYHVLFVTEELAAHSVPIEERRAMLADGIFERRAAKLRDEALDRARGEHHVEVERAALQLASKVSVE